MLHDMGSAAGVSLSAWQHAIIDHSLLAIQQQVLLQVNKGAAFVDSDQNLFDTMLEPVSGCPHTSAHFSSHCRQCIHQWSDELVQTSLSV